MKALYVSFNLALALVAVSCSSGPTVKQQKYAKLQSTRTFEYEFPVVWKGIEESLREYKITERDPNKVDDVEMKSLSRRTLETDWVYAQSRDKYQEYKVNGFPRKKYLQMRFKHEVIAQRVIGGVTVSVKTQEEVERLNPENGDSLGYDEIESPDSSRDNELLDKINLAILKAAP